MKVHLLFEQSGTFKEVFQDLGYDAFDYDIEDMFEKTDFIVDLFLEIENAFNNKPSIFDDISTNDLIIAFFPCTYFSVQNALFWNRTSYNFRNWHDDKIDEYINKRLESRERYYNILIQFISVINKLNLKTIIENPFTNNFLLTQPEMKYPDVIITNRRDYGDYYKKPTMFYFYNLSPTFMSNYTIVKNYPKSTIGETHGISRSLISKEFALNFIKKYIIGIV